MAKEIENTMVDNNVYLFTDINQQTTNDLIAKLSQWVDKLSFAVKKAPEHPKEKDITDDTVYTIGESYKIYTPYEPIPANTPVLNVYINSCGGSVAQTQPILTMFHIASARGAIIKTYNLFRANSSASMIAISGTHGYRYMAQDAYNMVHFGNISADANHTDEIEFATKHLKTFDARSRNIYLNNTSLTAKEISRYYNTEGAGKLSSEQCLAKELCDWIITNDGRFVNNVAELRDQKTR